MRLMNLARVLASLMVGITATAIGFRIAFFSAPVWVASFIFTKSGLRATNVTINLIYLATNILFWTVLAYAAFALITKRKQGPA
jgi:hypothetical protein